MAKTRDPVSQTAAEFIAIVKLPAAREQDALEAIQRLTLSRQVVTRHAVSDAKRLHGGVVELRRHAVSVVGILDEQAQDLGEGHATSLLVGLWVQAGKGLQETNLRLVHLLHHILHGLAAVHKECLAHQSKQRQSEGRAKRTNEGRTNDGQESLRACGCCRQV